MIVVILIFAIVFKISRQNVVNYLMQHVYFNSDCFRTWHKEILILVILIYFISRFVFCLSFIQKDREKENYFGTLYKYFLKESIKKLKGINDRFR